MPETLLDPETLDSFRELQSPADPNFLKKFLTAFLDPIPRLLEAIRLAIASGDSQKLAQGAHAIKSSCSNVGVTAIADLCAQIEQLGNKGSVIGAHELYLKTTKLCEQLTKEIHSLPEFNPKK